MAEKTLFGYEDALEATISEIDPLPAETMPFSELVGRITVDDFIASVDSPSIDVSLKDGYAVRSADVAAAVPENPVETGGSFFTTIVRERVINISSSVVGDA